MLSKFLYFARNNNKMNNTEFETYDVCVIGAGIEGSSTARYSALRGKKTLLLEQVFYVFVYVSLLKLNGTRSMEAVGYSWFATIPEIIQRQRHGGCVTNKRSK
jgi:2-polyprenyl-6-methoxyphenol hydroxylase-like FAD-dependent oxidoreductase